MRELAAMLQSVSSDQEIEWEENGTAIKVRITISKRKQHVRIRQEGNQYVVSTIVHAENVNRAEPRRRRYLAIEAWKRNAMKELVNFTFDQQGRLVGEIRHPADHLDPEELAIYLRVLATEGDRFEYVLTGKDEH